MSNINGVAFLIAGICTVTLHILLMLNLSEPMSALIILNLVASLAFSVGLWLYSSIPSKEWKKITLKVSSVLFLINFTALHGIFGPLTWFLNQILTVLLAYIFLTSETPSKFAGLLFTIGYFLSFSWISISLTELIPPISESVISAIALITFFLPISLDSISSFGNLVVGVSYILLGTAFIKRMRAGLSNPPLK